MHTGPQFRQLQLGCQEILTEARPQKPQKMRLRWFPTQKTSQIRGRAIANRRWIGYIPNRRLPCHSLNSSARIVERPLKRSCPHRPPRWPARSAQAPMWRSCCQCLLLGERHARRPHLNRGPAALVAPLNAACVAWSRQVSGARKRRKSKIKIRGRCSEFRFSTFEFRFLLTPVTYELSAYSQPAPGHFELVQ